MPDDGHSYPVHSSLHKLFMYKLSITLLLMTPLKTFAQPLFLRHFLLIELNLINFLCHEHDLLPNRLLTIKYIQNVFL